MIDPEFWLDENLATLSPHARLLYIGLWGICDDNYATLPNRPDWIKAQIFPYEPSVSIPQLLGELSANSKIILFTVEKQEYWYIKNFFKYQRVEKPSKPKYPEFSEANSINPRGVVGEELVRAPAEVKLSEVKLSNKDSETFPTGNARCPLGNGKAHKKCIQLIDLIAQEKKTKFPNYAKQINALHKSLRAGFKLEDIEDMAAQLIQDSFYKDAGWDLMTVANELGKKGKIGA